MTQYSDTDLVHAVTTGCKLANPNSPETTSQRQFDQVRATSGIKCPFAADIAKRLKFSWPELTVLVFDETRNPLHSIGSRRRNRETEGGEGFEHCVEAVRTAAASIGRNDIKLDDYEQWRYQLMSKSRGQRRDELEVRFPVYTQVRRLGWDKVAAAAGLQFVDERAKRRGVKYVDGMERFLRHHGYLPTDRELLAYAKEEGFALGNRTKSIKVLQGDLFFRRRERGLWTPEEQPKRKLFPGKSPELSDALRKELDLERPHDLDRAQRYQPKPRWTIPLIEAGLDRATRELPPKQHLTASRLRLIAKNCDDGGIPSFNITYQHGKKIGKSFKDFRDEAVARVRREDAERSRADQP